MNVKHIKKILFKKVVFVENKIEKFVSTSAYRTLKNPRNLSSRPNYAKGIYINTYT